MQNGQLEMSFMKQMRQTETPSVNLKLQDALG